jgi:hypothetical protein
LLVLLSFIGSVAVNIVVAEFEDLLNNSMSSGVYLITIKTSEGVLNSKFIKE